MNTDPKRILVVDDEPSITRLLKLSLEQTREFVVGVENSAVHAVAAAREFKPDLILLDVMMPEKDGGVVASEIQSSAQLKGIPIVFLTAAATKEEVASRNGQIGGLPFLAKPVDIPQVLACIRQHLPLQPSA